jgi:hypothetical protein
MHEYKTVSRAARLAAATGKLIPLEARLADSSLYHTPMTCAALNPLCIECIEPMKITATASQRLHVHMLNL